MISKEAQEAIAIAHDLVQEKRRMIEVVLKLYEGEVADGTIPRGMRLEILRELRARGIKVRTVNAVSFSGMTSVWVTFSAGGVAVCAEARIQVPHTRESQKARLIAFGKPLAE